MVLLDLYPSSLKQIIKRYHSQEYGQDYEEDDIEDTQDEDGPVSLDLPTSYSWRVGSYAKRQRESDYDTNAFPSSIGVMAWQSLTVPVSCGA